MCRLFGFHSVIRSAVHHSLVAAENALGRQSADHPDGWGVAFYEGKFPHVIRSDKQALEDRLFKDISSVVSTHTLIAHVRKATFGDVGILNCHPFQLGPWTFAHNGDVAEFDKRDIKEALLSEINSSFQAHIFGSTDSEICFHLFLSKLAQKVSSVFEESISMDKVLDSVQETVQTIHRIVTKHSKKESKHAFLISNGSCLIGYREKAPLFYSTYKSLCPERDTCDAFDINMCEKKSDKINHLILTSEHIETGPNVWEELKDEYYVAVDHGMQLHQGKFSL